MERLSVWSTHGNLYCMHPDSSSAIRGLIQSQSNLTCDALIFAWCETQSEKRMIVNDHFLYFPRSHEQTQCKHFGKTSKKNNHLHAWEKIYRHWIYNDEIFEPSIVFSSWQRVLLNSLDLSFANSLCLASVLGCKSKGGNRLNNILQLCRQPSTKWTRGGPYRVCSFAVWGLARCSLKLCSIFLRKAYLYSRSSWDHT